MAEPKNLMFDELSLGLAPVLVFGLFENLLKLKNTSLMILLVEQNVQIACTVSNYACVLAQSKVDLHSSSKELANQKYVREAYLGVN
jgi:branched-chain amino acid transport system ATP-binding protein